MTACVAIGPMIMMKFACLLTKKLEIPTIVFNEPDHGRWNRYVWSMPSDRWTERLSSHVLTDLSSTDILLISIRL